MATSASAHADWRIDRAEQIAAVVWNHPCNDNVPVTREHSDGLDGWVIPDTCTVNLDPGLTSWWDICRDTLHEFGHIVGARYPENPLDPIHSLNPRSVMYARPIAGQIDPRCEHRGRPFLIKHGLL